MHRQADDGRGGRPATVSGRSGNGRRPCPQADLPHPAVGNDIPNRVGIAFPAAGTRIPNGWEPHSRRLPTIPAAAGF
ncbi:hypothetical protein [Prevotella multiformis]|uniref:Uncharacterized protein n=1 Tax=Prevotella multiformis DSM 16608 TaxID=888743 RepID=F0F7D1_9BACT|nr:hypothetical protein [Prevotella multiformis]EGC20013.1 hypothetical protein HMPREF9141_1498 [Prevotella multiformis DSM 16608]